MNRIHKLAITVTFGVTSALILSCSGDSSGFTDKRDGKTYKIAKIGEQVWLAENLNYDADGSKCYDNNPENCEKYGRLYNWETAMKICPEGWHLPENTEWDILYRYADKTIEAGNTESPYESKTAGKHLKAAEGWNDKEGNSVNGEDTHGFTALPGGYGSSDGNFYDAVHDGYWWSATENETTYAYHRHMYHDEYAGVGWNFYDKAVLRSVRCIQD